MAAAFSPMRGAWAVSAVNSAPFFGTVLHSASQISGRVSPITSVWSRRTLVMTTVSAFRMRCWAAYWYSGCTAMHSTTSTWAFWAAAGAEWRSAP